MASYRQRLDESLGASGGMPTPQSTSSGGIPTIPIGGGSFIPVPSGRGFRLQSVPKTAERELAEKQSQRQMEAQTPVPTESERASTRVAKIALENIHRIRTQLGVNAQAGTVENTKPLKSPIGVTMTMPEWLGGRPLRNPLANEGSKQLRDDLENSFALLALLRTGKQGEVKQISNIRDTHNIGQTEQGQPQSIIRRLDDMERELRGFAVGDLVSPLDQPTPDAPNLSETAQSEMNRLLGR